MRLGSDWEFVVIGVHIKYDQAVTELYNITSVYDAVQGEWPSVKVDKIDVTVNSSMLIILILLFTLDNSYSNQCQTNMWHVNCKTTGIDYQEVLQAKKTLLSVKL